MGEYDDIIDEKWPRHSERVRMDRKERAKIFGAFAALKGYDESIDEQSGKKVYESLERYIEEEA